MKLYPALVTQQGRQLVASHADLAKLIIPLQYANDVTSVIYLND